MSARPYDEMTAPTRRPAPLPGVSPTGSSAPTSRIAQKREEAERAFHRVGITFAVYGDDRRNRRLIPFDIVPRIIPADEWTVLERGLKQRCARAQSLSRGRLSRSAHLEVRRIPAERVLGNAQYRNEMAAWMCRAASMLTSRA
jgi:uncharacterized circularly permuted ATP-grasp superfamily protein